MQILHLAVHPAHAKGGRKGLVVDAFGLVAHERLFAHEKRWGLGVARLLLFVPLLQRLSAVDVFRQEFIVERKNQLIVDQHILTPGLVLHVFDFIDQLLIGR